MLVTAAGRLCNPIDVGIVNLAEAFVESVWEMDDGISADICEQSNKIVPRITRKVRVMPTVYGTVNGT